MVSRGKGWGVFVMDWRTDRQMDGHLQFYSRFNDWKNLKQPHLLFNSSFASKSLTFLSTLSFQKQKTNHHDFLPVIWIFHNNCHKAPITITVTIHSSVGHQITLFDRSPYKQWNSCELSVLIQREAALCMFISVEELTLRACTHTTQLSRAQSHIHVCGVVLWWWCGKSYLVHISSSR